MKSAHEEFSNGVECFFSLQRARGQGTKVLVSMPWYITAFLFLLSPVWASLVNDRLRPKLSDWWAARSKNELERQICFLQQELKAPETVIDLILFTLQPELCTRRAFRTLATLG